MSVSRHVKKTVRSLVEDRRIVVWYDPDHVFHELFRTFEHQPLVKVDASDSVLRARREADKAWVAFFDLDSLGPPPPRVLIYVPSGRGRSHEAQCEDPFEPFALAGAAFGSVDSERLPSIARRVLPGREAEIDRLFAEGPPTLAQLDALAGGTRYPLVEEALGTEVPSRVVARLLCRPDEIRLHLETSPGLLAELRRLLADVCGFEQEAEAPFEAVGPALAQWLLFSELVFDLPGAVPESVAHVPRAEPDFRDRVFELCDDLRGSSEHRETYCEIAADVERRLGLSGLAETADALGERDTLPFEDRAALLRLQKNALAGEIEAARSLAERRRSSVWRTLPERDQLWRLAERCLDLLDSGKAWELRAVGASRPVADHVRAYCGQDDGMWRLDQAQRLLEQAAAVLVDRDSLAALLEHVRMEYRKWLESTQATFLESVAHSGWPAEGYPRQAQAWDRHAAEAVRDGRRTAWFLVDALRYEMGRELAERLKKDGTVRLEASCGVVPATTAFGMAALLPGAGTGLTYGERDGTLVPLLGGKAVLTAEDRRDAFRNALGDRFKSLRLGELLTASSPQLRETVGASDVLAVFSTEIDDLGERNDPLVARRYVSDVVADLLAAALRLVQVGFEHLVFTSDHGFIQLPEVLPGDRCREPSGRWILRKRRALLGSLGGRADSVVALSAASLGIQGPVEQVCVPRGVKVFRAGSRYFHEGLSLHESVVPLVVLDAAPAKPHGEEAVLVKIHYRSDRFTTRIFSVQVSYSSVLSPELEVRVQAFAPATARVVGESADCEARDPHTGLVTLKFTERVQVPIALEPDFDGDAVEVRVTDAATPGRSYASLVLRNATLD